jgi:hypothetical protein
MLILASPSDLVQVTSLVANQVRIHASYVDWNGARSTPGRLNTSITTTSTTTIVPAPAAGISRNVKYLVLSCWDSGGNTLFVTHTDGTTSVTIFRTSLIQYGSCTFTEGRGWQTFYGGVLIAVQG